MAQTNISIRVDEDVKKDAEALFSKLGPTLSAATNVFYRQAVRTQGIPFPLTAVDPDPFYSEENMERLRRSIAQMEATGGTVRGPAEEERG